MIGEKVQMTVSATRADEDLKRTIIPRAMGWTLTIAMLLTIGIIPIAQNIYEFSRSTDPSRAEGVLHRLPQMCRVITLLPSLSEVVETRTVKDVIEWVPTAKEISKFERALEDVSLLRELVLPPTQLFLSRVMGVGNEKVYLGKGQWLFYRPGVDYLTAGGFLVGFDQKRAGVKDEMAIANGVNPIETIVGFNEQMKDRGIRMILMPTTIKPQIYADEMTVRCDDLTKPIQNPSYGEFLKRLNEAGVEVFDFSRTLFNFRREGNQAFLKTDTHWTPEAMDRVAQDLVARIKRDDGWQPSRRVLYSERPVKVTHLGDIAKMLKLPSDQDAYDPETVEIYQVLGQKKTFWESSRSAPVLLMGDSFTNVFSLSEMGWGASAGLAERVSYHLQCDVDRIAINAGGAFSTRQQLSRALKRGEERLEGKKVVIWQFAMRELIEGNWRPLKIPMPHAAALNDGMPATGETRRGRYEVTGTVKGATEPPEPGTVPYEDCIVSIRLTDVRLLSGEPIDKELIVFVWGMRDGEWTRGARIKPGQKMAFHLTPWNEAEAAYGQVNRIEFPDEAALFLDAYWGVFAK